MGRHAYRSRVDAPERIIARRYRLRSLVGRGGHGTVWIADDLLLGDIVAVKLLDGRRTEWSRIRREIATLRALRLDGVVRLLDEGLDEQESFLVMEYVEGAPFPGMGQEKPRHWAEIAECTLRIFETLAQLHAAGVVHRDLKPDNILVRRDGSPILIDFGLSSLLHSGESEAPPSLIGTPLYAAPEQLRGETIDARTDLYALGVMLYEALAGRLPHESDNLEDLTYLRLSSPPDPLHEVAPDVPEKIAELIDLLLATEPDDRPASARDVAQAFRSRARHRPDELALPHLGSREPIEDVLRTVIQGMSVDLIGGRGFGKTYVLDQVATQLAQRNVRVYRISPGARPFSAVESIWGSLTDFFALSLHEAQMQMTAALGLTLQGGSVALVDDADRLDPYSETLLAALPGGCAIVYARENFRSDKPRVVVQLQPLVADDLQRLFGGPNRLFHVPEDAACMLVARTRGIPGAIHATLAAWERAGFTRREGDVWLVDRDILDQWAAGLVPPRTGLRHAKLEGDLARLLAWVCEAEGEATLPILTHAMREPRFRIEAEIRELVRLGTVCMDAAGRIEPLEDAAVPVSSVERAEMHAGLSQAFPKGSRPRLVHTLAAYAAGALVAMGDLVQAVLDVAEEAGRAGYLGQTSALFVEALRVLGDGPDARGARCGLVRAWVGLALRDRTPRALDRVLCAMADVDPHKEQLGDIEPLLHAAMTIAAGADRAGVLTEALVPFDEPGLECARRDLQITAARRMAQDKLNVLVDEHVAWAEVVGTSALRAMASIWRGRFAYQMGQFEHSARNYLQAADVTPHRDTRIMALFHAGAAWMEAFGLEEALQCALESRSVASTCRLPYDEARAEWLVRTIQYRQEVALDVDLALVDAIADIGVGDLEALACFTEATIAMRRGDRVQWVRLAERARRLWTGMNKMWTARMARCLALAGGTGALVPEARALAAEARVCAVPGFGVQMLGLLAMGFPDERLAWLNDAEKLAEQVPQLRWAVRMDALSVDEALQALKGLRWENGR